MKKFVLGLLLCLSTLSFAEDAHKPQFARDLDANPVVSTLPATTPVVTAPPVTAPTTTTTQTIQTTTQSTFTPTPAPTWLTIIVTVFGAVWTALLYPWLNAWVASQKSQAALNQIDQTKSLLEQRQIIFQHLIAFVSEHALSMTQARFPQLSQDIIDGKYRDPNYLKILMGNWTDEIKADAIAYFNAGGIDLVKMFGDKALVELINAGMSRVSPFPGKDTATELLDDKVAPLLLNYGVDWVRSWYLGTQSPMEVSTAKEFGHLPAEKVYTTRPLPAIA